MTKLMILVPNPHADRQIPWVTHLKWGQWFLSLAQGHILAVIILSDE